MADQGQQFDIGPERGMGSAFPEGLDTADLREAKASVEEWS